MRLEDILAVPDGEKAVLILAEDHETDCIEPTLELIEAFRPDAIAVELRPDTLGCRVLELFRELRGTDGAVLSEDDKEHLGQLYDYWSPMVTARAYAAKRGLPLYYLDWSPFCPLHQQDVLSETPLPLPYSELRRCFSQTIDELFGEGAAYEARGQVPGREIQDSRRWLEKTLVKNAPLSKEEERAFVDFYTLYRSHSGMSLRNEYTAMGLNALDKRRILYVCGKWHTHPPRELRRYEGFTPLHHLVDAPHTFLADTEYAADSDDMPSKLNSFVKMLGLDLWHPKKSNEKEPLRLPWDRIRFYCPVCHGE